MNSERLERRSRLYDDLYKGLILIDIGLALGAVLEIIRGPVLSSVLGYAEKPGWFGVLVILFLYAFPLLAVAALSTLFDFLRKQNANYQPLRGKRTGLSICIVVLTAVISIIYNRVFLTPISAEFINSMMILIPLSALANFSLLVYIWIKTRKRST